MMLIRYPRATAYLVALLLAFGTAACGGSDASGTSNVTDTKQEEDTPSFPDEDLTIGTEDTEQPGEDTEEELCLDEDDDAFFAGKGCLPGSPKDCNDADAGINPGQQEICGDGIDQNCDGQDEPCPGDCVDNDGDNYFVGDGCDGGQQLDCHDGNEDIHPGATEVCGDQIDQDCNGTDLECEGGCKDEDNDGYNAISTDCEGGDDCNDGAKGVHPGAAEICEDGIDQNCDGEDTTCVAECDDGDGDQYGDGPGCKGPDCNDSDANVSPEGTELCGDGIDQDCDGEDLKCPDECLDLDGDTFGTGASCEVPDCDDGNALIFPGATEVCDDGIDQNCDGEDMPCCQDEDGDTFGIGDCAGPDCNDSNPDAYPGADEICGDGIDQDCNGEDLECEAPCTDLDGDGFGEGDGCLGPDCDDSNEFVNPDAVEICENDLDDDCVDGDEACPEPTCDDNSDCGAGQICDLATGNCKFPMVWEYYAPVFYVDTEASQPGWNQPVAVNFDNDWNLANNATNVNSGSKAAVVYYSFVKTSTHWYLGYYLYFPRRWSSWPLGTEFDNMMTGVLLVVQQDGTNLGKLVYMETITDSTLFQYRDEDVNLTGTASIDGVIRYEGSHPIIYVHTEDHGCWGDSHFWNNVSHWEDEGFPDDDGIIYRYGNLAEVPSGLTDEVTYRLDPVKDTLWAKRNDASVFDEFGHFKSGLTNNARAVAPWRLYDQNYPTAPQGELLWNPADLVRRHFSGGWGGFSFPYVYNPYAVKVELIDMMVYENKDPFGNPSDPYINLYMCDGGTNTFLALSNFYAFQNNWYKDNVETAQLLLLQSEMGGRNFFYGCSNPNCHLFGLEIKDYDGGWTGDEWLMDPAEMFLGDDTGNQYHYFGLSDITMNVTEP